MSQAPSEQEPQAPHESLVRLFLRFLRFGAQAWGGPVAQIAMIRRQLVAEERWVSPDRFNRVFAVYQLLPGPEAHELCVYFGMLARGRFGGILAGLGFMLPGFVLMFSLSWLYAKQGGRSALLAAVFYGAQPAVAAVIIRAVHRLGAPVLRDRWLWACAIAGAAGQFAGAPFLLTLAASGTAYAFARRGHVVIATSALMLVAAVGAAVLIVGHDAGERLVVAASQQAQAPSLGALLASGLRTGLLTFGGAYTAIPFLQHDAVVQGAWMTNEQFLDGLALTGILPAPLVIFGTFVGFMGGGPMGAIALTVGIFLPAFSFTLLAHEQLERLVGLEMTHSFLDGVTAGVIGLIAVTAVVLAREAIGDVTTFGIAIASLVVLYFWNSRFVVPAVVVSAGMIGLLLGME